MDADALYADVIDKYSRHLNPGLARLMSFAGFGVETYGEGCYLFDHEGRKFLDCLGGYGTFSLGHRHPKVIEAVRNQLDSLGMSGKAFFSRPAAELATKLAEVTPEGIEFTFFSNSGAETVEAALKFAKGATGRAKIVSTHGGYHGKTLGALAATGREKYRKKFEPLMPGVVFVEYGDSAAAIAEIDRDTAAVIIETIQGEGGIVVPPDGYLRDLREACDRVGALLIADEVQTGLGRTGRMWGSNWDGVAPDLMTSAKALGGGVMPIGATMGTRAVFEAVYGENPLAHTSTFGGNPVACAAGLAAVTVTVEEGLSQRADCYGSQMLKGLQQVAANHSDLVSEARGRGFMLGMEFRMDEVGELVVAALLKRGMCVAYTLNNPRVLRFEPPLIIEESEIQFAIETLDESLTETEELLGSLV